MCCSSASGVSTAVPALYAGKFIAAFDRQHPRDLLDIRSPLAIDDWLRAAFIVYLLSDNRPMTEVLAVRFNHIAPEFVADFQGHYSRGGDSRAAGCGTHSIVTNMPQDHRRFLVWFD